MARPKKAIAPTLDRFLGELPPQDLIIMAAGFFAGTQGYTPMTALFKGFSSINYGSSSEKIQQDREDAAKRLTGDQLQAVNNAYNGFDWMNLLNSFNPLFGPANQALGGMAQSEIANRVSRLPEIPQEDREKVEAAKAYIKATMALGCMGLIEAYTITRPGFIQGVGEVVKGVGEIIPG